MDTLRPSTAAVPVLNRLPGWERVFADDIAVVHKRNAGASVK